MNSAPPAPHRACQFSTSPQGCQRPFQPPQPIWLPGPCCRWPGSQKDHKDQPRSAPAILRWPHKGLRQLFPKGLHLVSHTDFCTGEVQVGFGVTWCFVESVLPQLDFTLRFQRPAGRFLELELHSSDTPNALKFMNLTALFGN